MHYIGMAAMRLPASVSWNVPLVALSVLVAIAVSAVALQLTFLFGHVRADRWTVHKIAAALVMGLAIPAMHYIGIAAATFTAAAAPVDVTMSVAVSAIGTLGIAGTSVIVLVMAIGTSLIARYGEQRLQLSTERMRESERQLADAQATAHVGSWELDLATGHVTWSAELYRLYGVPLGAAVGYGEFLERVHPDDRGRVRALIDESLAKAHKASNTNTASCLPAARSDTCSDVTS